MAIQVGLVEMWKSYGISPEGIVGHSVGEVAGAYAAGALTIEQATSVIYHRSRGQHVATGKGKMLAVGVSQSQAQALIAPYKGTVSIGAVNGPLAITLSGDAAPLEAISATLTSEDVFNKFLVVNVPFHSYHMDPLENELTASLNNLCPSEASIPLYSTVSGKQEDGTNLVSQYWIPTMSESRFTSHQRSRSCFKMDLICLSNSDHTRH